jgi:uncharacterized phage protein (TIGR02216 family)
MPWGEMLRVAVGLGLSVEGFWRLSLREWRMLVAVPEGVMPLGRGELAALMEVWPDE